LNCEELLCMTAEKKELLMNGQPPFINSHYETSVLTSILTADSQT
jgi:hypothetical protein